MGWDYVERRVIEALKITRGNFAKTRQQIIAWTYEDSKLLYELSRPHMAGIVGHAIAHVEKRQSEDEDTQETPTQRSKISEQDINNDFGMEILKAIAAGAAPQFGVERNAPPVRKKPASQNHIDAINKMAGKKPKE